MPDYQFIPPFEYSHGWRDIVNDIVFSVEERQPDLALSTVWESTSTISLAIGQSVTVDVQASEPFFNAQDIEDGTDIFYGGAGIPVILLSRRSGQSATITITAAGGSLTITYLRLRARSVPLVRTVQIAVADSTSITRHGQRTYPDEVPWANQHDALAVAQMLLAAYAERRPTVSLRIVSSDIAHHLQVVGRQISDLITIRNAELGLFGDFFIENVQHTLARMVGQDHCPGPVHYATFGCERSGVVVAQNPFTFDEPGAGFDDGEFDPTATDNPETVFIFDHPTQGQFDFGRFGT